MSPFIPTLGLLAITLFNIAIAAEPHIELIRCETDAEPPLHESASIFLSQADYIKASKLAWSKGLELNLADAKVLTNAPQSGSDKAAKYLFAADKAKLSGLGNEITGLKTPNTATATYTRNESFQGEKLIILRTLTVNIKEKTGVIIDQRAGRQTELALKCRVVTPRD
jgi:hypothetical protein